MNQFPKQKAAGNQNKGCNTNNSKKATNERIHQKLQSNETSRSLITVTQEILNLKVSATSNNKIHKNLIPMLKKIFRTLRERSSTITQCIRRVSQAINLFSISQKNVSDQISKIFQKQIQTFCFFYQMKKSYCKQSDRLEKVIYKANIKDKNTFVLRVCLKKKDP